MPRGRRLIGSLPLALAIWALVPVLAGESQAEDRLDFNRDIRPILSDACFGCHGPDARARKAELRLDDRADAVRDREGHAVIVPGDTEASEFVARIEADDDTIKMPPPSSQKTLSPEQAAVLKRWVAEGAEYKAHWAFLPPERPALPAVADAAWPKTVIDHFLAARLDRAGLKPAEESSRETLIRRLTLDLTGLPSTPEEVDAFVADTAPNAYEALVNRLLESPRFGEQMARYWLDAARYGDTHGLHLDNYREMWPYRDWVVRAFNANQPFDQFMIEQLAGDMLPNPTLDQVVASGFNRAHVTTNEGGSIAEEVYVRNVDDRVDTTGTVFLGMTIGCAKCHDHKYDPLTMKDYYGLFAIFNSLDDNPMDGNSAKYPPIAAVPSPEQKAALEAADVKLADVRKRIAEALGKLVYDDKVDAAQGEFVERRDHVWVDDAIPAGSRPSAEGKPDGAWSFATAPDAPVHSGTAAVLQSAAGETMSQQFFIESPQPLKIGPGDVLFAYVFLDPLNPPKQIMLQWNTGNWSHRAYWGENRIEFGQDGTPERLRIGDLPITGTWVRLEVPVDKLGLKPGTAISGLALTQFGGTASWDRAGLFTFTPQPGVAYDTLTAWVRDQKVLAGAGLPPEIKAIIDRPRPQRDDAQKQQLRDHFVRNVWAGSRAVMAPLQTELAEAEKARKAIDDAIPTTLVSKERPDPKPAFLLDRGEYDRQKEQAPRSVPAFLPGLPAGEAPNRLSFARWLVAPGHPLTARVAVNRFWQQLFGTGLVKTSEDFGLQGEPPSHPELLDWLAVEFRESGWDVKALMKQMVMSAAYRQKAQTTPEKLTKDPANRLLSRGPRFRLDAEMLRDQALFVSGLLVDTMGGPSVRPPQPAGLWEAVGFVGSDTAIFKPDTGREKVHRRSLYTFWKRTSPPPQMATFDAPSRESCIVRRERTNTPLQALLLLNEPQFVEAARGLAQRGLKEGGSNDEERIGYLFRLCTGRRAEPAEIAALAKALADFRNHYKTQPEAARQLVTTGETAPDSTFDPVELAAWTLIGNTLLNLDEVLTKG